MTSCSLSLDLTKLEACHPLAILKPCSELSWRTLLPGHLVDKLCHLGLLLLLALLLLHLLHLKVISGHADLRRQTPDRYWRQECQVRRGRRGSTSLPCYRPSKCLLKNTNLSKCKDLTWQFDIFDVNVRITRA